MSVKWSGRCFDWGFASVSVTTAIVESRVSVSDRSKKNMKKYSRCFVDRTRHGHRLRSSPLGTSIDSSPIKRILVRAKTDETQRRNARREGAMGNLLISVIEPLPGLPSISPALLSIERSNGEFSARIYSSSSRTFRITISSCRN